MNLVHELGHFVSYFLKPNEIKRRAKVDNWIYGNEEEMANMIAFDQPIAESFNRNDFPDAIRTSHSGDRWEVDGDPTSSTPSLFSPGARDRFNSAVQRMGEDLINRREGQKNGSPVPAHFIRHLTWPDPR